MSQSDSSTGRRFIPSLKAWGILVVRLVKILNEIPSPHENVEIKVAGAASFDYFKKGRNKGFYIQKFIEHMGWDPADCIFFGDSFYPGGNDEPVIGIIETVEVRNHEDTYKHLLQFRPSV